MNNLDQNLNDKIEICNGLTYEPLAKFAAKYNGYYNRVVLESEEEINSILKVMQKTNMHMHVSLNELNFATKDNAKMRTLERAVAKNFNNATVERIDAWFQAILFPSHFYFDEKSRSFLFTIKTEMRAKKTGLNREFTNYVRVRFIKAVERPNRSLEELLEDAYEVFNEQFKEHMNAQETVQKIEALNEQIDFCKIQEKAEVLQQEELQQKVQQVTTQITSQEMEEAKPVVVKTGKITIETVYEEFCQKFPDDSLLFDCPEALLSYLECLDDLRPDLKNWEEVYRNFKLE